jgi:hypothetical protein
MKQLLLFLVLGLTSSAPTIGQNIYVHTSDGLTHTYPLIDVTSITFDGNVMNLNLITADTLSWNFSVIDYYNYDQWYVSVPEGLVLDRSGITVYPNPATEFVNVRYNMLANETVNVAVFDIRGSLIDEILSESQTKGEHSTIWSPAPGLSRGTYILRIAIGNSMFNKLIILAD